MNKNIYKRTITFLTAFFSAISTYNAHAQSIPSPEPAPYEPQVLVGQLPGDINVDNTGSANFNMPLTVPPGTAGMQPELGVIYNSRAGNGAMGLGFSISGVSSINRSAPCREYEGFAGGVEYNADDRLVLDGQRLLLVSTNSALYGKDGTEYRTEIESFQKVLLHGDINSSNAWFEVHTKSGLIYEYGNTSDSYVEPSNRSFALTWAVSRISDTAGNYMDFIYNEDEANGEHLLSSIEYTGNEDAGLSAYNIIDFIYTNRADVAFRYHEGARFNTTKRLDRVEFNVDGALTHKYEFAYNYGTTGRSQLCSIRQVFANGDSVPPTEFDWEDENGSAGFVESSSYTPPVEICGTDGKDKGVRFMDLNGDGLVDLVYHNGSSGGAYINNGGSWSSAPDYTPPFSFIDEGCRDRITFADINGDGLPDMFFNHLNGATTQSGAFLNTGSGWAAQSSPEFIPPLHISFEGEEYTGVELVDFNSDGIPDLHYHRYRNQLREKGKWLGTTSGWVQTGLYSQMQSDNDGGTDSGSRFMDVDGNRSLDELYAGTQWFSFCFPANPYSSGSLVIGPYNMPYKFIDDNQKSNLTTFQDLNGDGLPDFIYKHKLSNGTINKGAFLNTGEGWASSSTAEFEPNLILRDETAATKGALFVDLNGDGLPDMAWNNTSESGAWINSGTNWIRDDRYAPPQPIISADGKDKGARFLDINGDGFLDQISHSGSSSKAWLNASRPPLLKCVTYGVRSDEIFANKTDLTYRPLTDTNIYTKGSGAVYPVSDVQGAMLVVAELGKDDGSGGTYRSIYRYAHGRSHRDRGFLGFQIFESYNPQTKISKVDYLAQEFPLTGVPLKTETRYIPDPENNPAGQLIEEVKNNWLYHLVWTGEYMNYYSSFHYVAKSEETKWELGNTNSATSFVTTYNWFDGQDTTTDIPNLVQYTNSFPIEIWYGDITKITIDYGDGIRQITESSYLADHSNWLLGRLWQSTNTFTRGADVAVRTSKFDYYNGSGLLKWEMIEPSGNEWLKTEYLYDSFGNITNQTVSGADIATRSPQRVKYDSKGRFVEESKNALGHTATMVTDPITGQVKSHSDPNDLTTSWQFDSLGRAKLESRPDNTSTSTEYNWETGIEVAIPLASGQSNTIFEVAYSVISQSSGSSQSISYFDRIGREIRKVAEAPDGRKVYQDSGYNAIGQMVAVSNPYFPGDTPVYSYSEYDELGRPKLVVAPDGTKTAFGYAGLISTVTNNSGAVDGLVNSRDQITTTYKNAKGDVVKVVDNLGYEMNYGYDAAGNLRVTTDELNNSVVMEYDTRGNKVRQDDPDMGEWFYDYNVLGELISQTNANDHITTMAYDALGRRTNSVSYVNNEMERAANWIYDYTGEGGKLGGLWREDLYQTSTTNLIYRRTLGYDSYKRPMLSLYNVDSKWYYTTRTYDEFSRVKTTYRFWRPQAVIQSGNQLDHRWNSFESINTYNDRGVVTKVADGSGHVWWEIDDTNFDAQGHLLEYTVGNDVVTGNTFDPETGRIEQIRLTNHANGIYQYGFEHDRLGNLKKRTLDRTLKPYLSEDFGYDKLNRLTGIGADNDFVQYNEVGNITSKADVGSYAYNSSRPHAVTDAGGISYTYDACGNMLGRWENGTNVSSTAWTSFNKPSSIYNGFDGSEFTYDINNSRIIQVSFKSGAGTKKLYLDGFEQTETLTGSQFDRANWQWSQQETRIFVSTPAGVVGIHVQDTAENVTRRYLHKDHLGSIVAITGDTVGSGQASVLVEYAYDAWGAYRNPDDWTPIAAGTQASTAYSSGRGFTGHEMLTNLGLVHMNGRIYDSHLGRFLSADPLVQAPGDLQSYNRYSYVRNNPLSLTDPSGYSWLSKQWKRFTNFVEDAWNDYIEFWEEYWKPIVVTVIAVVVTAVTWGAASGPSMSWAAAMWAGALSGAAGGFAAGFSGTLLYGGSLSDALDAGLKGALWGGVSGAIAGGIGYYANQYKNFEYIRLAKYSAHGVRGGLVSLGQGDSFESGFLSGMTGAYAGNDIILAALAGGTVSALAGGKFINGAVSGTAAAMAAGVLSGGFSIQKSLDIAGKIWTAPNTALGLAIGLPTAAVTWITPIKNVGISIKYNAVLFSNMPSMGGLFGGAITFGNSILATSSTYDLAGPVQTYFARAFGPVLAEQLFGSAITNYGLHEQQHTYQYQKYGPFYIVKYFMNGGIHWSNPMEFEADHVGGIGLNPKVNPYSRSYLR